MFEIQAIVIQLSDKYTLRTFSVFMILLFCLLLMGCSNNDRKLSFSAHAKTPIPASAKLIHSGGQFAGLDASYGFVFDVSDNTLQEQLANEWDLNATSASESGFFKFAKPPWWPTDDAFLKMNKNFSRSDDENEEYWHVWHDQLNGKLYIEHGRW